MVCFFFFGLLIIGKKYICFKIILILILSNEFVVKVGYIYNKVFLWFEFYKFYFRKVFNCKICEDNFFFVGRVKESIYLVLCLFSYDVKVYVMNVN